MSQPDVDSSQHPCTARRHQAAAWYGVGILLVAYTFAFIDRTILSLLVEPIKHRFQLNDSAVSLLHGLAFAIFYTTLGLPLARLIDQRNRRNIITVAIVLWSAMTVACGFAQTYMQLFLARVGVGVGEAALSPAAYSMIHDWFPRRNLGRALSTYSTGICIGGGVAFILGGVALKLVASTSGFQLPLVGAIGTFPLVFLAVGLPGILIALLLAATVREPPRRAGPIRVADPAELRSFFMSRRRALTFHIAGFSLNALMLIGFLAWAPTLYIRKFGFSAGHAALPLGLGLLTFGTAGMVCGGLWGDRLVRRGRIDGLMRVALLGSIGVLPAALALALAPSPATCTAAFCVFFFFVSLPIGLGPASLQCVTPDSMRAVISAFYICILN